jgi:pimeloyl-ACP methyl ester carboxylesterase
MSEGETPCSVSNFARKLKNGRYMQADGSGHYVHRDAPNLVVRVIRSKVEVARSRDFERIFSS